MPQINEVPGMGQTTISVSDDLADELYSRKGRGETYEDVIWGLIEAERATHHDDTERRAHDDVDDTDDQEVTTSATVTDAQASMPTLEETLDAIDADEGVPAGVVDDELLDAIEEARVYLAAEGAAMKEDFVREVMPTHPLKYDADAAIAKLEAGDRYRGKWWRLVREGLKLYPDVATPSNPNDPWRYVGGDGE